MASSAWVSLPAIEPTLYHLCVLRVYTRHQCFSGVATLILNKNETDTISLHVKETVQKLLKLHANTPNPVVFFLAGVLHGEATLHLKQLTIFGMITRLPVNILHRIAKQMLICSPQSETTWFAQIRDLCYKYDLPHPLKLLHQPPKQETFKSLIKAKVTDFWQQKLRGHAAPLTSLRYFHAKYMSLAHPHPMWSAATDSYSVNKIIVVARMLSVRFRCGSLVRHFSASETGLCKLCGTETEDDRAHLNTTMSCSPWQKALTSQVCQRLTQTLPSLSENI